MKSDTGVRNYPISNFNPLSQRNDIGQLWENFLFTERKKFLSGSGISAKKWFWRTYPGAELDYIEERGSELTGYHEPRLAKAWSPHLRVYDITAAVPSIVS